MFPNLNPVQVHAFVLKMFNEVYEWQNFKSTLRDLLVSMKQMSSMNDELYLEEKEEAMKKAQMLADARSRAIPGLLAPA